jgi:hypothetical protein
MPVLGGKDNYAADRAAAHEGMKVKRQRAGRTAAVGVRRAPRDPA